MNNVDINVFTQEMEPLENIAVTVSIEDLDEVQVNMGGYSEAGREREWQWR